MVCLGLKPGPGGRMEGTDDSTHLMILTHAQCKKEFNKYATKRP